MLHFIGVFTVCQSIRLGVYSVQRMKAKAWSGRYPLYVLFNSTIVSLEGGIYQIATQLEKYNEL